MMIDVQGLQDALVHVHDLHHAAGEDVRPLDVQVRLQPLVGGDDDAGVAGGAQVDGHLIRLPVREGRHDLLSVVHPGLLDCRRVRDRFWGNIKSMIPSG